MNIMCSMSINITCRNVENCLPPTIFKNIILHIWTLECSLYKSDLSVLQCSRCDWEATRSQCLDQNTSLTRNKSWPETHPKEHQDSSATSYLLELSVDVCHRKQISCSDVLSKFQMVKTSQKMKKYYKNIKIQRIFSGWRTKHHESDETCRVV